MTPDVVNQEYPKAPPRQPDPTLRRVRLPLRPQRTRAALTRRPSAPYQALVGTRHAPNETVNAKPLLQFLKSIGGIRNKLRRRTLSKAGPRRRACGSRYKAAAPVDEYIKGSSGPNQGQQDWAYPLRTTPSRRPPVEAGYFGGDTEHVIKNFERWRSVRYDAG